jgi:hypothetical protein
MISSYLRAVGMISTRVKQVQTLYDFIWSGHAQLDQSEDTIFDVSRVAALYRLFNSTNY